MSALTPLIVATTDALVAGEDMKAALMAAARLLMDCTCQKRRLAESMAACQLADNALARWEAATRRMMDCAAENMSTPGGVQ